LNKGKEPFLRRSSTRFDVDDISSVNDWFGSWCLVDGWRQWWSGTIFNDNATWRINYSTSRRGKQRDFRRSVKKESVAILCERSKIHSAVCKHMFYDIWWYN